MQIVSVKKTEIRLQASAEDRIMTSSVRCHRIPIQITTTESEMKSHTIMIKMSIQKFSQEL